MTKRELNKLPAGGLTTALLRELSLKELVNAALHCFEKWKHYQNRCKCDWALYKREIGKAEDYLRELRRETFNKGLGWNMCKEELEEEKDKVAYLLAANEQLDKTGLEWRDTSYKLRAICSDWRKSSEEDQVYIDNLQAEIQQLKQHLATHLVPVPGNPGMSFIYYPN